MASLVWIKLTAAFGDLGPVSWSDQLFHWSFDLVLISALLASIKVHCCLGFCPAPMKSGVADYQL